MKLIKHAVMAMTLTFTTAAFAEKPEVQDVRKLYELKYVELCEQRSGLSGTMLRARYSELSLSTVMGTTEDRNLQAIAMYVYQQPYMASAVGRQLQEQQVKSMVLTECLQAM